MNPDSCELLNRSALRVSAHDPSRVGYWLVRHRDAEGLTDDALAILIGTNARGLALLALCETPRSKSFADDLRAITQSIGVNPTALANLLRQEQGFAEWASGSSGSATQTGWLLAAHKADQPPPGDNPDAANRD